MPMKKANRFLAAFAAIGLGVIGLIVQQNTTTSESLSDVQMKNIEALGNIEDDLGYHSACDPGGLGCHIKWGVFRPDDFGYTSTGDPDPDSMKEP